MSDNLDGVRLKTLLVRAFKKDSRSWHDKQMPPAVLDNFPELDTTIKSLDKYSKRIFEILRTQPTSPQLLIFFETLLSNDESYFFESRLRAMINGDEIASILTGELFEVLLEAITDNLQKYRFQVGIILSLADKVNIPPSIIEKIRVK